MKNKRFKILDLFSGAGGFSYGLEKNEHFTTVIATDFNKKALETFKFNMSHTYIIHGDITDINIKNEIIRKSMDFGVNMIVGGPPCQGFSLKGKKLGFDDPRNFLFKEYLSIVEILKPEIFVIENVKSILSTSAGWFKNEILNKVTGMGYFVSYGVLNSLHFGVPQTRERAIFICSKIKKIKLPIGDANQVVTVKDAIYDLAYLNSGEGEFKQKYITNPSSEYQKMMRNNEFL